MKHKRIHIAFLSFCSACLLYGGWLYISSFEATGYQNKIKPEELFSRPATISNDYEKALTKALSSEEHWTLKGWARIKKNVLHNTITPKVVSGKDDWLFLQEEGPGNRVVHQSLGIYRYSSVELKRWALLFKQRQFWAQAQEMDYLLVITPNKATIYPEYLPARFKSTSGVRTREQLRTALPETDIIDLTDSILNHKNESLLFLKNDTHWNEMGAFLAYRAFMNALPGIYHTTPLEPEACKITNESTAGGDLARLMMESGDRREIIPRISPQYQEAQLVEERSTSVAPGLTPLVYTAADSTRPKVFFDHDSFFKDLRPFLAEHFSESTFLWGWQGFHTELIRREKPQLVVDQFVERALLGPTPRNDWPVIQQYWETHFKALPLLYAFDELTFPSLSAILRSLKFPEGTLPILRIRAQPDQDDKLIIDYDSERGFYWLRKKGEVYYLEYEHGRIKDFTVEKGSACRLQLEIRGY